MELSSDLNQQIYSNEDVPFGDENVNLIYFQEDYPNEVHLTSSFHELN